MKVLVFNDIDSLGEDFIERCVKFIPTWRKDQMLKYKFLKGQIQNGLAYVMLVHLLCNEIGKEIVLRNLPEFFYNEHEKPFLKNYPDWHFNISHCKTAVAVAVSKQPLGIDIEDVARYKENLAEYISNADELKTINDSVNPDEAFIRLWTRKEAVFKYNGTGITNDIKNILQNIDCQIFTKKIGDKFISLATNESCDDSIFDNIFVSLQELSFI